MRTGIHELVEYIDDGEIPPWIPWQERGWNQGTVLLWLIGILHWLRRRGWAGETTPLTFRPGVDNPETMEPAMSTLVNSTPQLAAVLEFADDQLRFRASVPIEERREICQYVAENYHAVINT